MLDFTIGDEPYKRMFGAKASPMWLLTQTGSTAGTLADFALKQAPWIKQAAKKLAGSDSRRRGLERTGYFLCLKPLEMSVGLYLS